MKLDQRTFDAYLAGLRAEYENGAPSAVLNAVWACLDRRCIVPEWAAESFLRALSQWRSGRVATLDVALGFKPITPKRAAHAKRERLQRVQVLNAMHEDRLAFPDTPIGDETFERIGKACKMSKATAKRRYYAALKDPTATLSTPSMRALAPTLLASHAVKAAPARRARKRTASK